jgi:tRNA 2-selenouridine synthase
LCKCKTVVLTFVYCRITALPRYQVAIEKIDITAFLDLSTRIPVIDVRSPGEFSHASIPGAYSLPLFTDEERKVVGTAYKQQGREKAVKLGLDYFGVKMNRIIEEVLAHIQSKLKEGNAGNHEDAEAQRKSPIIVHCWRGGMRSAGVAWLLDLYGFKVYTLTGGYKAYRKWVLSCLGQEHTLNILGGYTGSGKTEILHHLIKKGEQVIDMEGIASHKGSAFGALGMPPQPSQEMFENVLALSIHRASAPGKPIWIEDESQRIGLINIPQSFWQMMRTRPVYFIDVPFESRLEFISGSYGKRQKSELAAAITRIQKRLGGLETKTALNYLLEDNYLECFRILLHYYDKLYSKALAKRPADNQQIFTIACNKPGAAETAERVLRVNQKTYA